MVRDFEKYAKPIHELVLGGVVGRSAKAPTARSAKVSPLAAEIEKIKTFCAHVSAFRKSIGASDYAVGDPTRERLLDMFSALKGSAATLEAIEIPKPLKRLLPKDTNELSSALKDCIRQCNEAAELALYLAKYDPEEEDAEDLAASRRSKSESARSLQDVRRSLGL